MQSNCEVILFVCQVIPLAKSLSLSSEELDPLKLSAQGIHLHKTYDARLRGLGFDAIRCALYNGLDGTLMECRHRTLVGGEIDGDYHVTGYVSNPNLIRE